MNLTKVNITTMEIKCPVPSCDMGEGTLYKTEKLEREMAGGLMQMHNAATHPDAVQEPGPVREGCPKAERVHTLIGQSNSQED